MATKARMLPDSESMSKRHSERRSQPISTPAAANTSAMCGPESPSWIGSGGSNSAQAKNSANQALGVRTIGQAIGTAIRGTHSTAFALSPGASATSEA